MSLVTIDRRNGLAYVTIDNPLVNSLRQPVRKDLLLACTSLAADKKIAAIVVSGKGRSFVAGADIDELGQTPSEPIFA